MVANHRAFVSRLPLNVALIALLSWCPMTLGQDGIVSMIAGPAGQLSNTAGKADPGNSHGYPSDTHYLPLHMKVRNALEAITLIDGKSCKLTSTGAYTTSEGPTFGKFSSGLTTLKDPSAPCEGRSYPYNFAYYTWTDKFASEPQDFFHLKWVAPPKKPTVTYQFDWLAELIPDSETTKPAGFKSGTEGLWQQTLHLTTIEYKGVKVMETQPYVVQEVCNRDGDCAPDSCWYKGSIIGHAFNKLSGGTWTVEDHNIWGYDYVGYSPTAVAWYRKKGRVPPGGCGSTAIPQQMKIQFDTGDPNYYPYGDVNLLGMKIYPKYIVSYRAGQTQRIDR